jgi:serine/threonine protein kinase
MVCLAQSMPMYFLTLMHSAESIESQLMSQCPCWWSVLLVHTLLEYLLLCTAFLIRCLDKNPKSRPSFSEILEDLTVMHAAYLAGYDSLEDGKVLTTATASQKRMSCEFLAANTSTHPTPSSPVLDTEILNGISHPGHMPFDGEQGKDVEAGAAECLEPSAGNNDVGS